MPRERVRWVRWGATASPLRQHEDRDSGPTYVRSGPASLPTGIPGFCPSLCVSAAGVPTVSSQDQGEGRALHRLSALQLLCAANIAAAGRRLDPRRPDGEPRGAPLVQRRRERPHPRHHQRSTECSLERGRPYLLPLPPPYTGRPIVNAPQRLADWRTVPPLQLPLSVYDALLAGADS